MHLSDAGVGNSTYAVVLLSRGGLFIASPYVKMSFVSNVSVEELKTAISTAMQQVRDGQGAITAATERLDQAQQALGSVLKGSAHPSVTNAQAALSQANQQLAQCLAATQAASEQAERYAATL